MHIVELDKFVTEDEKSSVFNSKNQTNIKTLSVTVKSLVFSRLFVAFILVPRSLVPRVSVEGRINTSSEVNVDILSPVLCPMDDEFSGGRRSCISQIKFKIYKPVLIVILKMESFFFSFTCKKHINCLCFKCL